MKGLVICCRSLSGKDTGDFLGTLEMSKSNAKAELARPWVHGHSYLVIMKEKVMAG